MLEIKNVVVVVVFIFLKHNGLCGRLVDSNYFYKEESMPCTNFCVHITLFVLTLQFVKACILLVFLKCPVYMHQVVTISSSKKYCSWLVFYICFCLNIVSGSNQQNILKIVICFLFQPHK